MGLVRTGRWTRMWPILLIVVVLASVVCDIAIVRAQSDDPLAETSGEGNPVLCLVQHLAFNIVLVLFCWYQRRSLPALFGLAGRNWIIGGEIVLLLAIVYGAFGSFGLPELFWDDPQITVGVAGFSAATFVALAWFAIYVVDYSRPERRRQRRLDWTNLEPLVNDSGLPTLLGMPTDGSSPRRQLGWFLAVACLPCHFLLALPAFLPTIRPSSDPRIVEWAWLVGLAIGAAVPYLLLAIRPLTWLSAWIQRRMRRPEIPPNTVAVVRRPGILLWPLGLIYAIALIVDRVRPSWVVPAALFCLLLEVIAVSVAFFLSIRSPRPRRWTLLLVIIAILLNGIQTYDPCYRGLEGYYPPDPLRKFFGLSSPFTASDRSRPIKLVDFQARQDIKTNREDAVTSRTDMLNAWKAHLQRQDRQTEKPIMVAVATCGGALRAGLWTAVVLDGIQQELPDFPSHVRYVTGASGGMVGAALFVASRASDPAAGTIIPHARSGEAIAGRLANDYLSPIVRQFILRDLPLAILPWRQSYDRGHALEDALVADHGLWELSHTFSHLLEFERAGALPSLVFSPMMVEDGRRLLISNLDLADLTTIGGEDILSEDPAEIAKLITGETHESLTPRDTLEFRKINGVSAIELFRLFPEARSSFHVVTALRMNATFPVVTPAGVLPTITPRQVVDAGYYDNYGVDLATALLFSHRDWLARNTSGVLLVQIRAFRNERQRKVLDQPIFSEGIGNAASNVINVLARGFRWITSPVNGLAEARAAVMHYRNDGQVSVLDHYFREQVKNDPDFFKTVVFTCDTEMLSTDEQQVETLNWHLSNQEVDEIKKNMTTRDQNRIRLKRLGDWWRRQMNSSHAGQR